MQQQFMEGPSLFPMHRTGPIKTWSVATKFSHISLNLQTNLIQFYTDVMFFI